MSTNPAATASKPSSFKLDPSKPNSTSKAGKSAARKRKPWKPKRWKSKPRKAGAGKPAITGAEIRARIAANRAKRLAIAEAMKREAGVTEHTVHANEEDLSGIAYLGTGKILSPEGRKIIQLYTLAHECGHIFLHSTGEGYWLPDHVKELEAETYAHQALREHGMTPPRGASDWGRQYVGSWVAKDRARGVPIDPRAVAYAAGQRSPYEPLRMVPPAWRTFCSEEDLARSWAGRLAARGRRRLWLLLPAGLAEEAGAVVRLAAYTLVHGTTVCGLTMGLVRGQYPSFFPARSVYETASLSEIGIAALGGLLLANLAVLIRGATR